MGSTTLKDLDFQSDRGFEMVYFRFGSPPLFMKKSEYWEYPVTKYSLAVQDRYNEMAVDDALIEDMVAIDIVDYVYMHLRDHMDDLRDLHGL